MPNFFGRRYMRGQPRRTERLLGAFVLVLLAIIVGLFALTGGLFANVVNRVPLLTKAKDAIGISEKPLFVAEAKNAKPAAPPQEMQRAMVLLPVIPGWERSEAWATKQTDLGADFERTKSATLSQVDMSEWGLESAFVGRYRAGDHKAVAIVYDAMKPEAAFGAFRYATAAVDGKSASVGCGGVLGSAGSWAAFWSGRYFTFVRITPDADQEILTAFIRGLASVQVVYGKPFWSESVLPREGQTERSFRYLKKDALGLEPLADCWLAGYENGLTIGVLQPSAPEKLLAALKQRASTQPAEGAPALDKEALAASSVSMKQGDRTLTAFDAGPYVFVVTAPAAQEALIASTAKMLHDRWAGANAIVQSNAPPGSSNPQSAIRNPQSSPAAGAARFAEADGLEAPAKIERFTDNLYEKIDGREPMFRSFSFAELRFAQYLDSKNKQAYDVYLYDMAEPNNALGIYMKERSGATAAAGVGRDSYVSGPSVYFWKGKYYVNVLGPSEGGEPALANAKKIATAIADSIADTSSGFWAEEVLPKEERVAASFKYIATSALSYDFLKRVYRADYKAGEKGYALFAKKCAEAKAAHELFGKLADASKKYGDTVEQRVDTPGSELLVSKSVDVYMVAFCKGVFVGGVVDCDDKELALKKAQLLRDRMPLDAAGEPEPASEPAQPEPEGGGEEH